VGRPDSVTDSLTYRDLAGRRRVRRYVLAAAGIFILLGAIVYWGWRQRQSLLALGAGTPIVTSVAGQPSEASPASTDSGVALLETQPSPTIAPTTEPSTAVPSAQPSTPETCPEDPSAWDLLDIARNDNFKRIAPPCVYDGLARTVAWDLLRVMGYSATEAADMMDFVDLPLQPAPKIIGMTNTRGPMNIDLEIADEEVNKQLRHPEFRTWIVDQVGNPGMTFTLRGCYRTETLNGNHVESWGVKYPVVCVVSVDQMEWAILELGSYRYTFRLGGVRQFSMYGYAGEGLWVEIGYQKAPVVEIRLPESSYPAVLPLTMELQQVVQDRKFISGQQGLLPWDAAWLEGTFGLSMRPLPENWQSYNDQTELQAIQEEANLMFERRDTP